MRKIYENPSLKSPVLYTKILNSGSEKRDYGAILLLPKSVNGFTKIMLMLNGIRIGIVQNNSRLIVTSKIIKSSL
ncbi:hypothetical protein Hc94105_0407 [Helicobacter cinaedi]|uniref:hypothetical protein n=1 Tax=Helicobacter cinaedi TaxID=213 RepID=UPI001F371C73|nr:hypothetical protein [Helicobacter cinaedi]BDB66219.1 hypothetical protein Hc94105_0407 [Helicobacter cinaedi]